jgi:hypothetical protein
MSPHFKGKQRGDDLARTFQGVGKQAHTLPELRASGERSKAIDEIRRYHSLTAAPPQ